MRVLRLAPYVTNLDIAAFSRSQTGFGRSVWDIAKASASDQHEEYLLTHQFVAPLVAQGVQIVGHDPWAMLRHISLSSALTAVANVRPLRKTAVRRLKMARHFLSEGFVQFVIRQLMPDVVHVHGLTVDTLPFIRAVRAVKCPAIFTLHGLNGIGVPNPDPWEHRVEVQLITELNADGHFVTVIGSGIRAKLLDHIRLAAPERVVVIPHGVDLSIYQREFDRATLRKHLGIGLSDRVVVGVGSLTPVKNQSAIIDAIADIPPEQRHDLRYFIIGDGPERARLSQLIQAKGLGKNVFILGRMVPSRVVEYLAAADLSAMVSWSEGFGRPFLESFAVGTPVLTFSDLDAVPDLFREGVLQLVHERSKEALTRGLLQGLEATWDRESIKLWARQFSWTQAVKRYHEVYAAALR